jgi:hypothetical protein
MSNDNRVALQDMINKNANLLQTNQSAAAMMQQVAANIANIDMSNLGPEAKTVAANNQRAMLQNGLSSMSQVSSIPDLSNMFPLIGADTPGVIDTAAGNTYGSPTNVELLQQPINTQGAMDQIYQTLLGRSADPAGMQSYNGMTRGQIIDRIMASPEYLTRQAGR